VNARIASKASSPSRSWAVLLAGSVIVFAAVAAYHNSFTGPFIFDDKLSILENPTIRHLWPVWETLSPPHRGGATVEGRPLINLSLAINYALGRLDVRGYHALNLIVHTLAGLTLFGVVRRTLQQPKLRERFGKAANELALATALLWIVHPLQTESVTYIVQRAESIMGLFYLLTLYCFIRGAESPRPRLWNVLGVAACALGMASKEAMVSAPLMVLLYDRTFVSGSLREAWRRRRPLYLGLAGTWVLLGFLLDVSLGNALTSARSRGDIWWKYLLTEPGAVLHYLRLSLWPHPLILDYSGWPMAMTWTSVLLPTLVVVALLGATVWACKKNLAWGFLGAWFFCILAPSSSVVPTDCPAYEHRMYLSLAAVVVLVALGIHELLGRRGLAVLLAAALGLGFLTVQRNEDYRSELAIWSDTVARRPNNVRAQANLGLALANAGRLPEAVARYEQVLQWAPDYADVHLNLGNALFDLGKAPDAMRHYEEAIRLNPDDPVSYYDLGNALSKLGQVKEAIDRYNQALDLRPDYADAHNNLGLLLAAANEMPEAIEHYKLALRFKPEYPDAHYNLGTALLQAGSVPEALVQLQQAVRLNPDDPNGRCNWGIALFQAGQVREAIEQLRQGVRLRPDYPDAHYDLGNAYVEAGNLIDAKAQYEWALRLKPDDAEVHNDLGLVLVRLASPADAKAQFEEALRLKPDFTDARDNLAKLQTLKQADTPKN